MNKIKLIIIIFILLFIGMGIFFIFNKSKTNEELFYEYYETDKVYINSRSGNEIDTLTVTGCLILFEENKLRESLYCFSKIKEESITKTYYEGVINMELKEYDIALYKFDVVIRDYNNIFYDQSKWYKGLCLLNMGNLEKSKSLFLEISKSDSYYKEQAINILKDMD